MLAALVAGGMKPRMNPKTASESKVLVRRAFGLSLSTVKFLATSFPHMRVSAVGTTVISTADVTGKPQESKRGKQAFHTIDS